MDNLTPNPAPVRVVMERHRNERRHSVFTADVPVAWLTDPRYFAEDGEPTAEFDQWMCDNGHESGVEHSGPDDHEDDDLWINIVEPSIPPRMPELLMEGELGWREGEDDEDPATLAAEMRALIATLHTPTDADTAVALLGQLLELGNLLERALPFVDPSSTLDTTEGASS